MDSAVGVVELEAALEAAHRSGIPVGIDAEWRPSQPSSQPPVREENALPRDLERDAPLALLQLAVGGKPVFLVDMIAFGPPSSDSPALGPPAATSATAGSLALRRMLNRLLSAPHVPKLGFAPADDLRRLEQALPGVTAGAVAYYDLQGAATAALGRSRRRPVGLSVASASLLGVEVDKSQQRSDWTARPLTSLQLRYAALDAQVLLPLADTLGEGAWRAADLFGLADAVAAETTRPPGAASEPSAQGTVRARARPNEAQTQTLRSADGETDKALPPLSTRGLPLSGLSTLLEGYIGLPLGGRGRALRLCAGGTAADGQCETKREIASAGGSGITLWGDGASCLWINTANSRPSAGRYRNLFWRESRGDLAGSVCFSWFLGRGQRLSDRSTRALLATDAPCLLFCRRQPGRPYRFCGRLSAVALAHAESPERSDAGEAEQSDGDAERNSAGAPHHGARHGSTVGQQRGADERMVLRTWRTRSAIASHIIWRLDDADELLAPSSRVVEELFGANGIGMARPDKYCDSHQG